VSTNQPDVRHSGIVDVDFGLGVVITEPVNLYGCEIGDGVSIGPFVEIQSSVSVGARTKVQSHTFICTCVMIGADCFIGHGVMFVNDKFSDGSPAGGDRTRWLSTSIADRVSIGSNATILPVKICSDVVVGAGAVVTKDILISGTYIGNPARLLKVQNKMNQEVS
jgi:acetyltransferase-like isoleucine patch superfamily enzyme